ncbi:hypothetical protein LJC36_03290, partial [Desulfovibrio sp. OttesenSCG-928-C14]|nr:hypothetical protein [Desulfovibrio sp. OttesenSCG-928-C14]
AFFSRALEGLRNKIFFNHLSRQLSELGLFVGLISALPALFLLLSALYNRGFFSGTQSPRLSGDLAGGAAAPEAWINLGGLSFQWYGLEFYALLSCAALILFLLFQFLLCLSWKKLRKTPLHLPFCLLCAVLAAFALCSVTLGIKTFPELLPFGSARLFLLAHPVAKAPLTELLAAHPSETWAFLAATALALPALASALGMFWLILRRARDDYGRDYYNFAGSSLAGLAFFFGLLSLAATAALFWFQYQAFAAAPNGPDGPGYAWIIPAALLGMQLACCLVWIVAAKSSIPMRHRPGMFLSFFVYAAATGLLLFLPLLG